jgi:predicted nuclease of predicted toxin-antitoxin system
MSRPRFLADQDFNEHIIRGVLLREPEIDFVRLRDVGLEKGCDAEILAYAAAERRILVSHDVNTMSAAANRRLAVGQPISGLLLIHQLTPLASGIDNLVLIWTASEAEEWLNQVCFLPL